MMQTGTTRPKTLQPDEHVQAHLQAVQRTPAGWHVHGRLTITWLVSYWVSQANGWQTLGTADVSAVQRLPVQEVQAIGG